MVTSIRAAVFRNVKYPWNVIENISVPELRPGTGLIKVELAGICGSDTRRFDKSTLHARETLQYPTIMGHESIGTIAELSDEIVKDIRGHRVFVGDRVSIMAPIPCGRCFYCMKVKEPSLCIDRFVYGGTRCDEYPFLTGGFAEYLYLLPRAAFVKVTKDIPVESALLSACALRTAFHALDLTNGIDLGSQVLIQGVGSVGLMMVALANESGAKEIIVIDASEERLRLAEEFGATQTISIEKMKNSTDRVKRVFESTDQTGADLAYCCTKSSVAVTEGIEMLRNGGKYVLIGYPGPTTLDLAVTVIQRGITIYGCRSSEPNHLIRSVELLETRRDKYPFQKVVGSIFPLSETNEALKAALMLEATKAAVNPWL